MSDSEKYERRKARNFGEGVRRERKARNMSMGDLAEKLGLSVTEVSNIEREFPSNAVLLDKVQRFLNSLSVLAIQTGLELVNEAPLDGMASPQLGESMRASLKNAIKEAVEAFIREHTAGEVLTSGAAVSIAKEMKRHARGLRPTASEYMVTAHHQESDYTVYLFTRETPAGVSTLAYSFCPMRTEATRWLDAESALHALRESSQRDWKGVDNVRVVRVRVWRKPSLAESKS